MKRFQRAVSILLTLCLCLTVMTVIAPPVSATDWGSREVQQKIVQNTALAFFYKGSAVQYGSYYISKGARYKSAIIRVTNNRAPEDATEDDVYYTVCSAFPHDVYFNAFGQHVLLPEHAPADTALSNAINDNDQPVPTEGSSYDYLAAMVNATKNYTHHAAMARTAGLPVSTIPAGDRSYTSGAFSGDNGIYADVLYYFGPKTNGSESNIGDLTQAKVEQIMDTLEPGDIVVTLTEGGGHAMLYVGDIDGDGVGEIMHSWGAKYNNDDRALPLNTPVPDDGEEVTGSDDGEDVEATDRSGFKKGVTQQTYEKAFAADGYYLSGAYITEDYLTGYDLRESAAKWSRDNYDGKNGLGTTTSATVGPNHGGSIIIEDWTTRLGPYAGFTSETKRNVDGSYNYDNTKGVGVYYPAHTRIGENNALIDGNLNARKFTVLRPLNLERFQTGDWQHGPQTAKGRYHLGDLCVTKTASVTEKQTVLTDDKITYTVTLWNPQDALTANSGNYSLTVKEFIPTGTTLDSSSPAASTDPNDNSCLVWDRVDVADGATATVSYTVKVTGAVGTKITSPRGEVWARGSTATRLLTKAYTHTVGEARMPGNAFLENGVPKAPQNAPIGYGTQIAETVYALDNRSLQLPDSAAILADLLETDCWTNQNKLRFKSSSKLQSMIVPDYVGGKLLMTYDDAGYKTNTNRLRCFREEFLEPGDVLLCANVFWYEGNNVKQFTLKNDDVYVCLGKGDANHTYYAHYGANGRYEVVNAPLKDIQVGVSEPTNLRFQYSPVLTRAMLYDFFVLLRPALVDFVIPTASAPQGKVAAIGQTGYDTLAGALTAATAGDTITLLADVTAGANGENNSGSNGNGYPLRISGKDNLESAPITLDLNGHTVTADASVKSALRIYGSKVALKNGTLACAASENPPDSSAALSIDATAKVTLTDVNLRNARTGSGDRALYVSENNSGTLEIHGGVLVSSGNAIVIGGGTSTEAATIDCGAVVHSIGKKPLSGDVTFNVGKAVFATSSEQYQSSPLYNITVSPAAGYAATTADAYGNVGYSGFTSARYYDLASPKARIGEEKYGSLSDALSAASAGDTITLLADIDTGATGADGSLLEPGNNNGNTKYPLAIQTDLTLDLNGHTISDIGDPRHNVENEANRLCAPIRIYSGTAELKNGAIVTNGTVAALSIGTSANVTLTDMHLEDTRQNNSAHAIFVSDNSNSTLTVSGGTYRSHGNAITVGNSGQPSSAQLIVGDGAVLHSANKKPLHLGGATVDGVTQTATAVIRKAVLATDNAALYQTGALIDCDVTGAAELAAGYACLGRVPCESVGYDSFAFGDYYDQPTVKAIIGSDSYGSLTDALSAASAGDTITLLADIDTGATGADGSLLEPGNNNGNTKYPLAIRSNLTLDLNGHTISDIGDPRHNAENEANRLGAPIRIYSGTAELKNGAIVTNGTVAALSIGTSANVTLTDMHLEDTRQDNSCRAVFVSESSAATLTIHGGTYLGYGHAITVGNKNRPSSVQLTVDGGAVLHGINKAPLYLTGGTVDDVTQAATAVIRKAVLATDNAEVYQTGALINHDMDANTVTGNCLGRVPCESVGYDSFAFGDYYDQPTVKAIIGSDSYGSLTDALSAASAGDTITLLADIDTGADGNILEPGNNGSTKYPLAIRTDLTLDLNGHTISDIGDPRHNVENEANRLGAPIRIYSGTAELKNGAIVTNGTVAALSIGANANVTLTSMNLTNGRSSQDTLAAAIFVSEDNSGTLNICGGVYQSRGTAVYVSSSTTAPGKNTVIQDGAVLCSADSIRALRVFSGSATLDGVYLASGATTSGPLYLVGDGVTLTAQSSVAAALPSGVQLSATPTCTLYFPPLSAAN